MKQILLTIQFYNFFNIIDHLISDYWRATNKENIIKNLASIRIVCIVLKMTICRMHQDIASKVVTSLNFI